MSEYHVGCGCFGIYAGIIKKPGEWKNKSEVTDEALCAVRDYLSDNFLIDDKTQGGYEWTRKDGKIIQLMVILKDGDNHA